MLPPNLGVTTMSFGKEFQEIGHSGGKVRFTVKTTPEHGRKYSIGWSHSAPRPSALFAVWALPQGVAVAGIKMGGIGTPWNDPPVPGCFPVMIGSDSQGHFGHQCPSCRGYWRSNAAVMCPYCAARGDRHMFLTDAQNDYVHQYCAALSAALQAPEDGEHVIDMDAVADAVGKDCDKPQFYYAEESQQKNFLCDACGGFNDILGKFCYCSACGTRNDLHELQTSTISTLRKRANEGAYENCISDAVGAFDTFTGQYVKQLLARVPLRTTRKAKLERMRFHNLQMTASEIKAAFDIDILEGISSEDRTFAELRFHRRHVYEHNGGVADQKYLTDSGDTARMGQALHETQGDVHRLLGIINRLCENFHSQFHDLFPPEADPIKWHAERKRVAGR